MSLAYGLLLLAMAACGLATARHSAGMLRLALFLAVLLPYAATSGPFAVSALPDFARVHPITVLVLVAGVRAIVRDPPSARALVSRYRFAVSAVALLVAAAFWWTLRARGHPPGALLVDQVVVPLGLLLWVRHRIERDPDEAIRLPRFVVGLGCVEAAVGLAGGVLHIPSVWGIGTDFDRQAATTNGPLVLALLLTTCVPLAVTVRSSAARVGALLLLLGGILTTQSRSALVIAILCSVFVVFAGRASVAFKVVVVLITPVIVWLVLTSTVVSGVASRFADDLGSAALRSTAADYFWSNLDRWTFEGQGLGASYAIASAAGLQSSFESAFYMYAVDLGLIVTVVAFALLLLQVLIRREPRRGVVNGGVVATLAAFSLAQGYSSIATETVAGVVIFVATAFGSAPFVASMARMPLAVGESAAQR